MQAVLALSRGALLSIGHFAQNPVIAMLLRESLPCLYKSQ